MSYLEFILARSFFAFFRAFCLSSPSFMLSEETELSVTISTMYFFKERCSQNRKTKNGLQINAGKFVEQTINYYMLFSEVMLTKGTETVILLRHFLLVLICHSSDSLFFYSVIWTYLAHMDSRYVHLHVLYKVNKLLISIAQQVLTKTYIHLIVPLSHRLSTTKSQPLYVLYDRQTYTPPCNTIESCNYQ